MRTIKLMADYFCFPLWEASLGKIGNIDPTSLPISTELQERLIKWADTYDGILDQNYPPDSRFKSQQDEDEFRNEAYRLADQLKSELGEEYDVIVHLVL